MIQLMMAQSRHGYGPVDEFEDEEPSPYSWPEIAIGGRLPQRRSHSVLIFVASSVIGTIFGSIHLAGWNLEFPSDADKLLWRCSSITSTAIPLLFLLLFWTLFFDLYPESSESLLVKCLQWATEKIFGIGILLYLVARIVLLVEMIRSLFYLPPMAYVAPSWTNAIPHIS